MTEGRAKRSKDAHHRGHLLEYIALLFLWLKGYHILGFRLKSPFGEIDILATKGQRLAVIEVKSRQTLDEALFAVSQTQQKRLWQAGQYWQNKRPHLKSLHLNIDLFAITKEKGLRHIINAFDDSPL